MYKDQSYFDALLAYAYKIEGRENIAKRFGKALRTVSAWRSNGVPPPMHTAIENAYAVGYALEREGKK